MSARWLERIKRRFLRKPPLSGCFDPAAFERLCLENPQAAIEALQFDQRDLAEQFEATCLAYQEKLNDLAVRLNNLEPKQLRRESKILRETQDAIRKILRRLEAAMMSATELERELKEWSARRDESGLRHADHPDVRAEIARSEMAVRSRKAVLRAIPPEESPFSSVEQTTPNPSFARSGIGLISSPCTKGELEGVEDELPVLEEEHLLQSIRQITRDVERWHSAPNYERDALDDLHELKKLHALLRDSDKKQGLQRDRLELAVRMRE